MKKRNSRLLYKPNKIIFCILFIAKLSKFSQSKNCVSISPKLRLKKKKSLITSSGKTRGIIYLDTDRIK